MGSLAPDFEIRNVTSITDFIKWANYLSGGILVPLFLLAWWIIIYSLIVQIYEGYKAFTTASLSTFVITVYFVASQILDPGFLIIPLVFVGMSGFFIWRERE